MKKITKIIATTMAAVALMASSAMAFSLGYVGPVKFKYSNWEVGTGGNGDGVINQVGETLSGIGLVSQILKDDGSNSVLWDNTTASEELTIQFGGYQAYAFNTNNFLGGTDILFNGGWVKVFEDANKNFSAVGGPGGASGYADGSLFLDTIGASATQGGPTLISNVSQLGTQFRGFGSGYLDIVGGTFAGSFSKDFFGPGLDLSISSTLSAPGTAGWPVGSEDPVRGNVVPEPGTIALFGAGLVGLILYKRKRG